MTDPTAYQAPPRDPPIASTAGRSRLVVFIASLVLLICGVIVGIAGTRANAEASDDRDAEEAALRAQQEATEDAEQDLQDAKGDLEVDQSAARSTSEMVFAYVNPAQEAVTINERDLEIAREQREISLAADPAISRFNQLSDEANSALARYNELIDQLNVQLDELRSLVSAAT